MMVLLLGTALAAELGVGAGFDLDVSDAFVMESGLSGQLVLVPAPTLLPWFAIGASAGIYPDFDGDPYRALTLNMGRDWGITPDCSPVRHRAEATLQLTPARQDIGAFEARLGVHGGVGVVHTLDDEDLLLVEEHDPAYAAVADQWHLTPVYGLHADLRGSRLGLRLDYERTAWTEQVLDLDEERGAWWLGTSVILWR